MHPQCNTPRDNESQDNGHVIIIYFTHDTLMCEEGAGLPPCYSSSKTTSYTHDNTATPACCYDYCSTVTLYGFVINTWGNLHIGAFQARLLRDDHGWHHFLHFNGLMNGNHSLVEILHQRYYPSSAACASHVCRLPGSELSG